MGGQENKSEICSRMKAYCRIWSFLSVIFAFLLIASGYFLQINISRIVDRNNRLDLLARVETIALMANAGDVAALTGTDKDLSSPSYLAVKKMLYDLHNINNGTRFLYFMRSNETNNKLVFLADSESPDSPNYSKPGEVYNETSELQMSNYLSSTPFVEGPYRDRWGTWVSGYAPVWWQGKMVGIIGVDISATKWENEVNSSKSDVMKTSALLAGIFLVVIFSFSRLAPYLWEKKEKRARLLLEKKEDSL